MFFDNFCPQNNDMRYITRPHRFIRHLPTLPFIYFATVPIIFLDIWIEIYHRICFPFYNIPYVKRSDYIKIDRQKLSYLGFMQKLNCTYCGYANGAVKYWTRIFAETERYWCAIQHQQDEKFEVPEHHAEFIPFGDEKAYKETYDDKKTRML